MNHVHIVDTCPLTKFEGELNLLHEADDDGWNVYSDRSMRGGAGGAGGAPPPPNDGVWGHYALWAPPTLTPVDRNKNTVFTNWC